MKKKSLKNKILIPIIGLIVAVMAVSTAITYLFSARAFKESIVSTMALSAQNKADLIDVWIEDARGMIATSADRSVYEDVLKNETDESREKANIALTAQMKHLGVFSYINLVNPQGEVRASTIPASVGKVKVGDREYFKKAMLGEVNVSTVYLARTTGKPAYAIAAPIKDGPNVIGVLVGVPDLTKFSEKFVDPVKIGSNGYLYLFDSSGIVFAHRDKSLIMKVNLKEKDWGQEILKTGRGAASYSFNNVPLTAYLAACKDVNWTVAAVIPSAEIMQSSNAMALINMAILIIGLALIVAAVYFIVRSVISPINKITEGLYTAADQVSTASDEVASAGQSLAEGSSEQASAIEETSSSLEEMTAMTRRNADNATQAKSLMTAALGVVERVDGHVNNMAAAVGEVTRSSEETGKIIKTIDEIAFQTNLLALNAAVEAARAGEAGAGFAVVADEVRNLAVRAAEAARSTSGLIENTIATVQKSRDLTAQTQEAFKENKDISLKVSQLVDDIAVASREQAQGIGQINKAVMEMEKVVQQTAANAEESASAAEEMSGQSRQMKQYAADLAGIINGV
ncbi:MAG: methyl-accepting chemotaxis protein [Deltaproteobacteria bacterium]|jgi:methyl-accepting chemotaxis protein|nr:methyl-accepting chemotaxis protein [Syntrophaceae bacterium]